MRGVQRCYEGLQSAIQNCQADAREERNVTKTLFAVLAANHSVGGTVNRIMMFVLMLFAIALTPVGKADGINPPVQALGIVNATVGITPAEDAFMPGGEGFGRIFLGYVSNGLLNGFVYWIASPSVEPFTVSGGHITFLPGNYNYAVSSESLDISATSLCCADVLTFYGEAGTYSFTLPSIITPALNPTWHTEGGDEYEVYDVPVEVSTPVSEPGTLLLLGIGLVGLMFLSSARRT